MDKNYQYKEEQRKRERDPYSQYQERRSKNFYEKNWSNFDQGHRAYNRSGNTQDFNDAYRSRSYDNPQSNFRQQRARKQSAENDKSQTERTFTYDDSHFKEKYEKQYSKAKREEELRRAEEFEQMAREKEEMFYQDIQDKLDKGRDFVEEFSKKAKTKGVFGSLKSMFSSDVKGEKN